MVELQQLTFGYRDRLVIRESPEQEAERKRIERERSDRRNAIIRLWSHTISELRIRHPDPRVEVLPSVSIYSGDQLVLSFTMRGLRDTSDPDRVFPVFHHTMVIDCHWPGYEVARAYVTASWVLYMMHEGMELVTLRTLGWPFGPHLCGCGCGLVLKTKEAEPAVVSAHDDRGVHQQAISYGTRDVAGIIDWALGLGNGRTLIERNAERATKELAAELDPWIPGT